MITTGCNQSLLIGSYVTKPIVVGHVAGLRKVILSTERMTLYEYKKTLTKTFLKAAVGLCLLLLELKVAQCSSESVNGKKLLLGLFTILCCT